MKPIKKLSSRNTVLLGLITATLSLFTLSACVTNDVQTNNARGNFEALWKIMTNAIASSMRSRWTGMLFTQNMPNK